MHRNDIKNNDDNNKNDNNYPAFNMLEKFTFIRHCKIVSYNLD